MRLRSYSHARRCCKLLLWTLGLPLSSLPACGGGEIDDSKTSDRETVVRLLGDFELFVESMSKIRLRAAGRDVLDGLPAGPVQPGDPPLVGFAVRPVTATYEHQFGSFKTEEKGAAEVPWTAGRSIRSEASSDVVLDEGGAPLARLSWSSPGAGHLVLDVAPLAADKTRFSFGWRCRAGERFVGFGSQAIDVDERGQSVPVWVSEQGVGKAMTDEYEGAWQLVGRRHAAHWSVAWGLSSAGYAFVGETRPFAKVFLCEERDDVARMELDLPSTIHLFVGDGPKQITSRATGVFGRPRVPPKVAFAPWHDAIKGPDNVLGTAKKLRDLDIPSSVIWTEDWRGGEQMGDAYALDEEWDVDTSLYPDMKGMTDALHALGFKFHVYFNPFVFESSKAWGETAPKGWLVHRADGTPNTFLGAKFTKAGLLDLTNPDARAWAIGKMHAAMALGADGFMNDFAEWLPVEDSLLAGGTGLQLHNEYAVLWAKTARDAIDTAPDKDSERLFFGRSGWLGTSPLMDVFWAGDQRTDFQPDDGLPTVPVIGINMSVLGCPTFGHDIAGYQSATNPPSTKELYFRWTSLGAFSPVMRTHHGYHADKQWRWDKDDETIAHFRKMAKLHVQLAPLLEALAEEAHETGISIQRGLFLEFPGEDAAWTTKDELLLGPNVLVAPVVAAGKTSRPVWIPPGTWLPFEGGAAVTGPTTIEVPAALGEIPVFVRSGTVLSLYPDELDTLTSAKEEGIVSLATVGDDREVRVYGDGGRVREVGGLVVEAEPVAPVTGSFSTATRGARSVEVGGVRIRASGGAERTLRVRVFR